VITYHNEDADIPFSNDTEAIVQRNELDQLRNQLLPNIVFMYHDICTETALWMSKSLDDAAELLHLSPNTTIREIDDTKSDMNIPVDVSPISPRYRTLTVLELAEITMNDKFDIHSAFRTNDYKFLLSQLAETTTLWDWMYRYVE
jgi:hypothetical protein